MLKKMWQSNRYVSVAGYRFYYKRFFLLQIAKPLGLPAYRTWRNRKNRHKFQKRKAHGLKTNPRWTGNRKKELAKKYGHKCVECGFTGPLTLDHIVPLSVMGKEANTISNLQLLCFPCHTDKGRQENYEIARLSKEKERSILKKGSNAL